MPAAFPIPVLAVAADAVRGIEGEDALPGLWTLFTKCKESLRDGRRLENISWRLWYRSMALSGLASPDDALESALEAEELFLNEKSYRPPTPEEGLQQPPTAILNTTLDVLVSTQAPAAQPRHTTKGTDSTPLASTPSLSQTASSRRGSFKRGATPVNVGRILCDLLPTATVPSLSSLPPVHASPPTLTPISSHPTHSADPRPLPSISIPLLNPPPPRLSGSNMSAPTATQDRFSSLCLPTPETEPFEPDYSQPPPALSKQPDTMDILVPVSTSLSVPVITANHSSPALDNSNQAIPGDHDHPAVIPPPPRLVVVNPTPNPTPHPTPPATPVLHPPVTPHIQQGVQDDVAPALSAPLLRVPGQDALAQAQARARTHQMSSRLRLLAHEIHEEEEGGLDTEIGHSDDGLIARSEAQPIALPCEELERPVNTNRHSTSSDFTTSSSSQRSSSSSRSEYSNTTTATTISDGIHHTLVLKHHAFPPSEILPPSPVTVDTSLSPTSPSYGLDSPSSSGQMSPASKRRKEKDGSGNGSGSPAGKTNSSASSTSRVPRSGSVTSNKTTSPSGGLPAGANMVRRTSSGVSVKGRGRVTREGSTTSVRSGGSRNPNPNPNQGTNTLVVARTVSSGKSNTTTTTTTTTLAGGGGGGGGGGRVARGRVVGASRTVGRGKGAATRKQSLNEAVKEASDDLKRAIMFNFGSGSDEGSHTGSKSTGSGSEIGFNNKRDAGVISRPSQRFALDAGAAGMALRKGREVVPVDHAKTPQYGHWEAKGEEETGVVGEDEEKGKGKEKKEKMTVIDTLAVPARVEDTIADPLLPGSARREIVIVSDSEYESGTDSWSDTDSAEAVDVRPAKGDNKVPSAPQQHTEEQYPRQQQQQQHPQQRLPQQQFQHHHGRPPPPPLLRTQSHNFTRNARQLTRVQQQRLAQQLAEEAREQQWREEMFTKIPKSSLPNLTELARTQSVGLLSRLLNPGPDVLPENHPYRRGFSSGAIQPLGLLAPLAPIRREAQQLQPQPQHRPQPQPQPQPQLREAQPDEVQPGEAQLEAQPGESQPGEAQAWAPPQAPTQAQQPIEAPHGDQETRAGPSQHSRQSSRHYPLPQRMVALNKSSVGAAPKTPAATAIMSQLQAGSINGIKQTTSGGVAISTNGNTGKKSGYKPKAPPPETVLEDTSDSENDENELYLPKSVAQEKLKALLEAKKMKEATQVAAAQTNADRAMGDDQASGGMPHAMQPVEALPIPMPRMLYPYDLPAPNPPTTPRTTRRRMLQTEMPESLRRNLLWERQVSQAHPRGLRRAASSSEVNEASRPVWVMPTVVRLTLKGTKPEQRQETREEKRARFLARNRSWAYEYHNVGW